MSLESVVKDEESPQETKLNLRIQELRKQKESLDNAINYRKARLEELPDPDVDTNVPISVELATKLHNNATKNLVNAINALAPILKSNAPVIPFETEDEDDVEETEAENPEQDVFATTAGAVLKEIGPDGVTEIAKGVIGLFRSKNDE